MMRIRFCAPVRRKLYWVLATAVLVVVYNASRNIRLGKIVLVTNVSSWTTDVSAGRHESIQTVSTSSVTHLPSGQSPSTVRQVNGARTRAEQIFGARHTRNSLTTNGQTTTPSTEQLTRETGGGIPSIVDKHADKAAMDRNSESNYSTLFDRSVWRNTSRARDDAWQYAVSPNKRSMPSPPEEGSAARTNLPKTKPSEVGQRTDLMNPTAGVRHWTIFPSRTAEDGYRSNSRNATFEVRHIFFLKVHKAASTTVMNMMYRFSLSRNLSVMLPRKGNQFSETSKNWWSSIAPVLRGSGHFDILCNHLVFSPELVERALPADAKYIAILRHPLQQTISAFYYYRSVYSLPYLRAVPGQDPLATYLADPGRWDPKDPSRSFTMNRMSFDFGLDPKRFQVKEYLEAALAYLSKTFDLVMVSERFDESAVLLRRLLGWRWKDILYATNNALPPKHRHEHNVTAQERRNHRLHNAADYALYEHFSDLFERRVLAQGDDFVREVAAFQATLLRVDEYCDSGADNALQVAATPWDAGFSVSGSDCSFMRMKELPFVELVRKVQASRRRSYHRRRVFLAPPGRKLDTN